MYFLNPAIVIDNFVIYFHPRMDQKRKFLTPDDHLSGYSTTAQQVCRDSRSLQAHCLFGIPGQRPCNSIVDLIYRWLTRFLLTHGPVSDKAVKCIETYQLDE